MLSRASWASMVSRPAARFTRTRSTRIPTWFSTAASLSTVLRPGWTLPTFCWACHRVTHRDRRAVFTIATFTWRPLCRTVGKQPAELTLNYGVRWDRIRPWLEKYNQLQTLVKGEQSQVFPGAPKGLVFPGDPGVPHSLAPARNDFAPRVGVA